MVPLMQIFYYYYFFKFTIWGSSPARAALWARSTVAPIGWFCQSSVMLVTGTRLIRTICFLMEHTHAGLFFQHVAIHGGSTDGWGVPHPALVW